MRIFKLSSSALIKYFPACLSGFLLSSAFPDFNLFPLAFIGIVPLFLFMEKADKKNRFFAGLAAGFIQYLLLIHWFVPTMVVYGRLNILVAAAALILICLYFSLYFGLFSLLTGIFKIDSLFMPFFAACLWVSLEFLRTHIFSGFPWGIIGYSQYLNNQFIQIADITGVYGVSFFIILINGFAALIVLNFRKDLKKTCISGMVILVALSSVYLYGIFRTRTVDSCIKESNYARLAVIQGNIRQDVKWNKRYIDSTLKKYCALSEKAAVLNPDLIVWPETSLPFYYGFSKKRSETVDKCIRNAGTNFLIGSPAFEQTENGRKYFNRAYMLNRFSIETGKYDKVHLVPFGEYVPLGKYLSFLGKLTSQSGDFTAGQKGSRPLSFGKNKAGMLICFEIIFPSLSREFVGKGADVLLTITNDAWFGRSAAAEQHFSMAAFRAVENRRSLARAANTGISGFVDPNGHISEKSDLFVEAGLVRDMPVLKIKSFYTVYGDLFAILCSVAIILCFVVNRLQSLKVEEKALD